MTKINPFITSGYISAKYFCDRITETTTLTRYITNGNNVALISPSPFRKNRADRALFSSATNKGSISHIFNRYICNKEFSGVCI